MAPGLSVYLDAVRLLAACVVVVHHAFGAGITGGFLWQVGQYGPTAVMVFFVLSGYVIQHVIATREHRLSDYAVARLARLYSVVVPALALGALAQWVGDAVLPAASAVPWERAQPDALWRWLMSLVMLQDVWQLGMSPPNNGSFWSLSYEFSYYVLFAVLVYLRGGRRWGVGVLVALVAGPAVLALAPVWLAGVWVCRRHQDPVWRLPAPLALLLAVGGGLLLLASPWHRDALAVDLPGISASLASDLLDGAAFGLHLLGLHQVMGRAGGWLAALQRPVARAATLTFPLYLMHLPVLRCVAGLSPWADTPGAPAHIALVYGLTLAVVVAVGVPAERSRAWWRRCFQRWLAPIGRRTAAAPPT
ncbi:acyltransferase family protein [Pseudaquabacterium rugosum]|uniref:Acyltransferase n=1 Tax=Pseudaquabacterium rugosum TaxID=2984194 RepID=A0ABU9BH33_9BURK